MPRAIEPERDALAESSERLFVLTLREINQALSRTCFSQEIVNIHAIYSKGCVWSWDGNGDFKNLSST